MGESSLLPLPLIILFKRVQLSMKYWVKNLDLKLSDRTIIEKGGKFSDCHMYAAHELLRRTFPNLGVLQSTLLSETSAFQPVGCPEGT